MTTANSQHWLIIFIVLFLGALIYFLAPVLTPFLIAAILAYFFNPTVDRLVSCHLPRILAVIIVFLIIFLIGFFFIFLIVPIIEQQIIVLLNLIPEISNWITNVAWPWISQHLDLKNTLDLSLFKTTLSQHLQESSSFVAKSLATVSRSGIAVIHFFANLILIPVVTFYLLCDWEKITKAASNLLPKRAEAVVIKMLKECGDVLAAFFRGQLLVMISLGIIYSIGLWLVGLNVGILIGALAGLLSIVPYLGFIIGVVTAIFAAFMQFHDWLHIILVLGVFGIGEITESFVLVPWLVGDRVGLHPIAVIFAILAGGQLFGFVGILLAVPVSAVIMVFLRYLYWRYIKHE